MTAAALPRRRWAFRRDMINWKTAIIAACVAFTVYVALIPLCFLLWQSFFTPQTATKPAV